VSDFYDRRDLSTVTDFGNPTSKFVFGFEALEQVVYNASTDTVFEISFDGRNVHGRVGQDSPKSVNWTEHLRIFLFVRRAAGTGGTGSKFVEVIATTR